MARKKPQPKTPAKPKTKTQAKPRAKKPATDAIVPTNVLIPAADVPPQPLSLSVPAAGINPLAITNLLPVLTKAFNELMNTTHLLLGSLPIDHTLTGPQRKRLIGVRARKWGFVTKSWEIVAARPNFAPANFSITDMSKVLANVEQARQLLALAEQLVRLLNDYLLTQNDALYREALRIYRSLQDQARSGIQGADELFQILRQFFMLHRPHHGSGEPTEHQLEVDLRRALHGKANGEIIIKNESPHMVGGAREVVDTVRKRGKGKAEIKVREEE